jgi:hypothetical protein
MSKKTKGLRKEAKKEKKAVKKARKEDKKIDTSSVPLKSPFSFPINPSRIVPTPRWHPFEQSLSRGAHGLWEIRTCGWSRQPLRIEQSRYGVHQTRGGVPAST